MIEKLQAELLKAQDNLSEIEVKIGTEKLIFYFRYLTLLEKVRIEQMCIKTVQETKTDGSVTIKYEKQDHLIPSHTNVEKALDAEGKRLFSHTKPDDFTTVSLLPAGLASLLAYEMSRDIFGSMTPKAEDGK